MASNTTFPHSPRQSLHPYYPLDIEIENYAANSWSVPALLTLFFGACILLLSLTRHLTRTINPHLSKQDQTTILWFVLSGTIHLLFEGYYATHWSTLGSEQHPIAQMWKEYAFSDSRYLTGNSFVLCVESMTVLLWGPGCLFVAWLIVTESPMRFPVQLIVSVGQAYGDALYYATSMFDHYMMGLSYSRPEAFYFWVYFFAMNFIWIVVPGALVWQSVVETSKGMSMRQGAGCGPEDINGIKRGELRWKSKKA